MSTSAQLTVEAAILDGVAETAHLTGLVASSALEAMCAAIRDSLFSAATLWAVTAYARVLVEERLRET